MKMMGALAMLLLLPGSALAEIAMGEAIEWVTMSRPHIAIVKVDATRGTGSKGHVTEVLKGEPPKDPVFRDRTVEAGTEYLVFFDATGKPETVYDLTAPKTNYAAAIGMDFAVLETREKILAAVRARLARGGTGERVVNIFQKEKGFVHLEIPYDTTAHTALYGGSSCYLAVPADPELKVKLVGIIRDAKSSGWDRAHAARKLSAFPGDETIAFLRTLLMDPAIEDMSTSDGKTTVKFTVPVVRQAAWEALKDLGVTVPKPKGYRDDYEIRPY